MGVSDFDELFEQTQNEAFASLLMDSKVLLVTEYDEYHPLKTGEFLFIPEENTLYVGAGNFATSPVFNLWQFIRHDTSVLYIPAPRFRTGLVTVLPNRSNYTNVIHIPSPRIKTELEISMPTVYHNYSLVRVTNTVKVMYHLNVAVPTITHSSVVTKT